MNQEKTLQNILEVVRQTQKSVAENREIIDFLKDNMASKADIANMATKDDIANMATKDDIANMATKDDIKELRNEMIEHVDKFIGLSKKQDVEIAALGHRQNRVETKVDKIVKRLKLKFA